MPVARDAFYRAVDKKYSYQLITSMLFQHRHWVEAFVAHEITRIHDVEDDREDDAGAVNAERDPPQKLLVKSLLEVLQHDETNCEPSYGAGDVRDKRHWRDGGGERLAFISRVDGETDVARR